MTKEAYRQDGGLGTLPLGVGLNGSQTTHFDLDLEPVFVVDSAS